MNQWLFRDREDAARRLAERLADISLHRPLVLGIPRGGVVTAAYLARELDAELDVVLSRKLRHPLQPELAIGAISEDGDIYLPRKFAEDIEFDYLQHERERRLDELQHRRAMFRDVRPPAAISNRTVILTDDGMATGSTMFSALQLVKAKDPREMIVAVPLAPAACIPQFTAECNQFITLRSPEPFAAIGHFYQDFAQLDDLAVCRILRDFTPEHAASRA